ncbi:MAG: glutamine synthetase adenylyltransferase [Planctomycetaceae bacterium]
MLRLNVEQCRGLLWPEKVEGALLLLAPVAFDNPEWALERLRGLCRTDADREHLTACLPALLVALNDAAAPDASLKNFERYVLSVADRTVLFANLSEHPRAVEILFRLFVGSQYLTEILLNHPESLDDLTQQRRLAEFKSRLQFTEEARRSAGINSEAVAGASHSKGTAGDGGRFLESMNALRRYQQLEVLRLAACDTFHLVDLKRVTLQLSLLADALTQCCLELSAAELGLDLSNFVVLAFGKLGGEELNYSSDIDLLFLSKDQPERYWGLGQKLIRALGEATKEGFLYRVDMRLRPWGRSGPLVTTPAAYVQYLRSQGRPWELQALLKARPIAGARELGESLLHEVQPILFSLDAEAARRSVREMKGQIDATMRSTDHAARDVKLGSGGIRDIEFLTQYLQLANGRDNPQLRVTGTLEALVRLTDAGCLLAGEHRRLSSSYVFQRSVEHALQLMQNRQQHELPQSERELQYLAHRLDFPTAQQFLEHYHQHRQEARQLFERHVHLSEASWTDPSTERLPLSRHLGAAASGYEELFRAEQTAKQIDLLDTLSDSRPIAIRFEPLDDCRWELTIVGYDRPGDLSLMCGLLFAYGCNIDSGFVFTGGDVPSSDSLEEIVDVHDRTESGRLDEERAIVGSFDAGRSDGDANEMNRNAGQREAHPTKVSNRAGIGRERRRKFVDVFTVRLPEGSDHVTLWGCYESDLLELTRLLVAGDYAEAQGRLVKRVAQVLQSSVRTESPLLPIEIAIDNESSAEFTVMHIRGEDVPGFLYEMTNALTLSGVSVQRMLIHSAGPTVTDTLFVTNTEGGRITDADEIHEMRAAIVLTRHFTHLLPSSPNPESALMHFRGLLKNLFRDPHWLEQLATLQQPDVLGALVRVLGGSDFLWEDFLRLQHSMLFPVLTDIAALQETPSIVELQERLNTELAVASSFPEQQRALNRFKDREMFRVDMRHILDLQTEFGQFSAELTDIAELVVQGGLDIVLDAIRQKHGEPESRDGRPCRLAVCAMGKCGGRELGFASDIELLFIYEGDGTSSGPHPLSHDNYFSLVVEQFRKSIITRRRGIFEIDLRMRPYGKAGSLASSRAMFERYFATDGPAWPFERQALVKLRPIAGDAEFGNELIDLRDRLVYTNRPFDVAAMRGMRQRQVRELVRPGEFNAKLSPGGLVDCEYFVQGLQMTCGWRYPEVRHQNTREALKSLERIGLIEDRRPLRDAYRFLRRLIDALRMVRGDARDLAVPLVGTEEFEFLARRLNYGPHSESLQRDIEEHSATVRKDVDQLESIVERCTKLMN